MIEVNPHRHRKAEDDVELRPPEFGQVLGQRRLRARIGQVEVEERYTDGMNLKKIPPDKIILKMLHT